MQRSVATLAITVVLALLLAACGNGVVDAGPVSTGDTDAGSDLEPDEATAPDEATEPEPDPEPDADPDTDTDAGTGTGTDSDTAADASDDGSASTSDPVDTTMIRLYYVAPGGDSRGRPGPFLVAVQREIPSTPGIARATLDELIEGPSSSDAALIDGIASSVPSDTLVLGINIDDGLATVDLSREFESGGGSFSMLARLAQVVFSVTQFPTVNAVEFLLDGEPVTVFSGEGIEIDGPATREDLVDLLPRVFVDRPAAGAEVAGGSLRMTGTAAVFEAEFQYRLETEDGKVLAEGFAMTDNGVGWGSFDATIDYEIDGTREATLTVWEYSAKDGSVQAERVTPLTLRP